MMYEGKCPHCGNVVRGGHGLPMKRIDTPVRTCARCGRKYTDDNMYEWAVLATVYKLWFYFGANNRGLVLFLLLLFGGVGFLCDNIAIGIGLLVAAAIWMTLCFVYVKLIHKNDMIESQARCSNSAYIQLLNNINYDKLALKFDNFYSKDLMKLSDEYVCSYIYRLDNYKGGRCEKCGLYRKYWSFSKKSQILKI